MKSPHWDKPIEAIGLAAPGFGAVPYLDVVVTHDP